MKKFYFYSIEDDFYSLFEGENLKAFLELFFRREDSVFYKKQFDLFVKEIKVSEIKKKVLEKYLERKDLIVLDNGFSLENYFTSKKEILLFGYNYIVVETDHEVSPFINMLADNFPDLICIDANNYKIERIGLVSSTNIS